MENENAIDENVPQPVDALLEKIKNFFLSEYHPISTAGPTTLFYSTQEIYNSLQAIYPLDSYGMTDVANWLNSWGFAFASTGDLKIEWMLEKESN